MEDIYYGKGYTQVIEEDYKDIYTLVARLESI